ncbi:MAG TPA: exonuclease domain-containing protein, partial [Marinagarivorans sp.]
MDTQSEQPASESHKLLQVLPVDNLGDIGGDFPSRMALVDIETTGGKVTSDCITEIAVIIVDDGEVVGCWQSLVKPEKSIPPFITELTGISNAMVSAAPRFAEIAPTLLALLTPRIFVAHNARFDYGFIKQAFKSAGIGFSAQPLCSVKLSRALFPGFKSHSMDALIKRFNIQLPTRHRALADCLGIVKFFAAASRLLNGADIAAACRDITQAASLPAQLPKSRVNKIPNAPGVYYFYDQAGLLLYIGKSVSLKKRVMSHFYQDHSNPKDLEMSSLIADVQYLVTASDFGAQLLESQEIKRYSPPFNRRLKKVTKLYQIQLSRNTKGYYEACISTVKYGHEQSLEACGLFRSKHQALEKLRKLADSYYLCHQLLGLEPAAGRACFRAQLKRCFGACAGHEPAAIYNQRLLDALAAYRVKVWPYPSAIVIQECPQVPGQRAASTLDDQLSDCQYHLVNEWRYLGRIYSDGDLAQWG